MDSETGVLQAYSGEALVKQHEKQTPVDPTRLYFFELATDTKKFSDGADDEFLDWARNRNQVITDENQAAQANDDDDNAAPDLGSVPLPNYNLPYGGVTVTPGLPNLGNAYPYGGVFFNSYAVSPFWTLPPLPAPALIIGRRWAYRTVAPHWQRSGTWTSPHGWTSPHASRAMPWPASPHPAGLYPHPHANFHSATFPRPVPTYSRPLNAHPVATPHVGMPAGRVGRR
jgi:hypothetical protein